MISLIITGFKKLWHFIIQKPLTDTQKTTWEDLPTECQEQIINRLSPQKMVQFTSVAKSQSALIWCSFVMRLTTYRDDQTHSVYQERYATLLKLNRLSSTALVELYKKDKNSLESQLLSRTESLLVKLTNNCIIKICVDNPENAKSILNHASIVNKLTGEAIVTLCLNQKELIHFILATEVLREKIANIDNRLPLFVYKRTNRIYYDEDGFGLKKLYHFNNEEVLDIDKGENLSYFISTVYMFFPEEICNLLQIEKMFYKNMLGETDYYGLFLLLALTDKAAFSINLFNKPSDLRDDIERYLLQEGASLDEFFNLIESWHPVIESGIKYSDRFDKRLSENQAEQPKSHLNLNIV